MDVESVAERLLSIGIDLCNLHLVLGVLKVGGKFLVDGGEVLAMATPRGEELDEGRLARLQDHIVEIGGNEVEDGRLGSYDSREAGYHKAANEHGGLAPHARN